MSSVSPRFADSIFEPGLTQLSHRYASDTRNAPENCGVPRPMSICGAKNHCPFRGHLALTGSTLMCWRRCSRNAVRTVGRRKSRLDHRFSLGALQSELPPPWHVWCLNRSAPHNALISSHIFSSGGKVGFDESVRILLPWPTGQSPLGRDQQGSLAGTSMPMGLSTRRYDEPRNLLDGGRLKGSWAVSRPRLLSPWTHSGCKRRRDIRERHVH